MLKEDNVLDEAVVLGLSAACLALNLAFPCSRFLKIVISILITAKILIIVHLLRNKEREQCSREISKREESRLR